MVVVQALKNERERDRDTHTHTHRGSSEDGGGRNHWCREVWLPFLAWPKFGDIKLWEVWSLTREHARTTREGEIRGFLANENRAIIMTNLHTQHTFIPNTEGLPEHWGQHCTNMEITKKKWNLLPCGRTQSTQDNTFLLQKFSAVFGES
jgi:hypothetical protein